MSNLAVTNTFVSGNTIQSAQVNTNYSDIVTYINNRNAGTTSWDGLLSPSATFSNTTNQIVLGTTNTTTLSATAPAASVVYTIPDVGGAANFLMSIGTQSSSAVMSMSGAWTFTGNTSISNTKFQISGNQAFPILQIVQATNSTPASVTSTSFTDTGLSVTITPKFNTSKILLFTSGNGIAANSQYLLITLANGSTNLLGANGGATLGNSAASNIPYSFMYYDSPATTSAITYKVRVRTTTGTSTWLNSSNDTAILIAVEIAQ